MNHLSRIISNRF